MKMAWSALVVAGMAATLSGTARASSEQTVQTAPNLSPSLSQSPMLSKAVTDLIERSKIAGDSALQPLLIGLQQRDWKLGQSAVVVGDREGDSIGNSVGIDPNSMITINFYESYRLPKLSRTLIAERILYFAISRQAARSSKETASWFKKYFPTVAQDEDGASTLNKIDLTSEGIYTRSSNSSARNRYLIYFNTGLAVNNSPIKPEDLGMADVGQVYYRVAFCDDQKSSSSLLI